MIRWLNITLRTLHLIGMAGIGAALLFAVEPEGWLVYLWLTIGSGVGMMVLYSLGGLGWLLQLRGLAMVIKLMVLALIPLMPGWSPALTITVILVSGLIAHAPGAVRYYRPLGGS